MRVLSGEKHEYTNHRTKACATTTGFSSVQTILRASSQIGSLTGSQNRLLLPPTPSFLGRLPLPIFSRHQTGHGTLSVYLETLRPLLPPRQSRTKTHLQQVSLTTPIPPQPYQQQARTKNGTTELPSKSLTMNRNAIRGWTCTPSPQRESLASGTLTSTLVSAPATTVTSSGMKGVSRRTLAEAVDAGQRNEPPKPGLSPSLRVIVTRCSNNPPCPSQSESAVRAAAISSRPVPFPFHHPVRVPHRRLRR